MLPNFSYLQASSSKQALEALSLQGARIHAGGTDLLGCLRDGVFDAQQVVSISRLETLRGIQPVDGGGLRIGALTTIAEVAEHPVIEERYAALAQAASEVASPPLRNQGTLGGNLCQKPRCWYYRGEFHCLRKGGDLCFAEQGENQFHGVFGGEGCYIVHPSDTAPALVALQASVRIAGAKGSRSVRLEDFFVLPAQNVEQETVLEPGEMVTEIVLPRPVEGLRSSYRKVRARRSWDFSLAGVALALRLEADRVQAARVVFSGAAPIPWRSREAEDALVGQVLNATTAAKAAQAAVSRAEPLAHNEYKVALLRGVLEEELLARRAESPTGP